MLEGPSASASASSAPGPSAPAPGPAAAAASFSGGLRARTPATLPQGLASGLMSGPLSPSAAASGRGSFLFGNARGPGGGAHPPRGSELAGPSSSSAAPAGPSVTESLAEAAEAEAEALERSARREEERRLLLAGAAGQKALVRPLTPAERRWRILINACAAVDLFMVIFFVYQGFFLYANSGTAVMDPLAEQLAFGCVAAFIVFKNILIYYNIVGWFPLWFTFVFLIIVGEFYGAINCFLLIYNGNFPCFIYDPLNALDTSYSWSICQNGLLMIAFSCAVLYLVFLSYFTFRWRNWAIENLKKRGLYETEPDVVDLLHSVEQRLAATVGVTELPADSEKPSGVGLGLIRSRAYLTGGGAGGRDDAEREPLHRDRESAYKEKDPVQSLFTLKARLAPLSFFLGVAFRPAGATVARREHGFPNGYPGIPLPDPLPLSPARSSPPTTPAQITMPAQKSAAPAALPAPKRVLQMTGVGGGGSGGAGPSGSKASRA